MSAAGSTLAASASDSAASPRNAMMASEASGARTSPAAAKSTTTDHRGALPKARRAGTSRGRGRAAAALTGLAGRSEEHTPDLQSRQYLVCRLLLEKKNP